MSDSHYYVQIVLVACILLHASVARPEDAAVSYETEIKPIFRSHCLGCHNNQDKKGDLALDTYASAMAGGASGEVIHAADLESSRLWALVDHAEQPFMPPNSDRISDASRNLLRQWILDGAAERAGTARAKAKQNVLEFRPASVSDDSSGIMPNGVCRQPVVITERAAAITTLATSPRAPLLAVGGQMQTSLYDTQSSELLGVLPFPEGTPQVIRFSRDGSLLLIAGGRHAHSGFVALHDVATGRRRMRLADEVDSILAADIDVSLRYVAIGGPTKLMKVFSTASGEPLFEIKKHTDWITAIEFSPDGRLLASADRGGGLVIWEAENGREYQVLDGHKEAITSLDWRGDSKILATCSEDDSIRLWNPERRKAIRNWVGHQGGCAAVRFHPDGSIVSAGRDRSARHWDGSGKHLRAFTPLDDIALSVAVSSDGERVFAGDWTGALRGYDLKAEQPVTSLAANPSSLEQQLAAAQQKVAPLEVEIAELRRSHEAAVTRKHAAEQEWKLSLQTATSIREQMAKAQLSIDKLSSVLSSDDDENETEIQTRIDQFAEQLGALSNSARQLAEHSRTKSTILDDMRRQQEHHAERLQTAESRLIMVRSQIEQLKNEIQSFDNRVPELESLVAGAERNLSNMREDLRVAQQQLAHLEALNARIEALEQAIAEVESKTEESRSELEWLREAYGSK